LAAFHKWLIIKGQNKLDHPRPLRKPANRSENRLFAQ
jgi:hypothetical protein